MTDTLELVRRITKIEQTLDGLVKPEVGRYQDWTPTVTQLGAVAATVTEAKYIRREGFVHIYCELAITAAGTANNAIVIGGIPAAIVPSPGPTYWPMGIGHVVDTGTNVYHGTAYIITGAIHLFNTSAAGAADIGVNPNFALANGDFVYLNMYWKI